MAKIIENKMNRNTADAGASTAGTVENSGPGLSIYTNKKRVSYSYRTATTAYPCYLPILGEFSRSWSYETYPAQK